MFDLLVHDVRDRTYQTNIKKWTSPSLSWVSFAAHTKPHWSITMIDDVLFDRFYWVAQTYFIWQQNKHELLNISEIM
jgi:hypothetical protein